MNILVKICRTCKQPKVIDCFGKGIKEKDGLRSECKDCYNARMRNYNSLHKEVKAERDKRYRKNNKEKVRECEYKWRKGHDYERTPQRKAWKKKYDQTLARIEYKRKYMREYEHCPKRKEYNRVLYKRRWDTDENFKIARLLRGRLKYALKSRNITKNSHAIELLGCSVDFLKKYIELQFSEGMNWRNNTKHGWHIDHIIPVDSFDLRDIEQQRKCFHWTNLQPLWSDDNWRKGNKILAA